MPNSFFLSIESSSQVWCIGVCSMLVFLWLQNIHFFWSWGSWSSNYSFSLTFSITSYLCKSSLWAWTSWDNVDSLSRLSWFINVFWSSSSSVGWDLTNVFVNEVIDIWSNVLWVSNIMLLSNTQVLETWVQMTVVSMFFSWVWSWVHAVIGVDKSMDCLVDSFVTDITLFWQRKMLETWVQNTVNGVLLSWIWSWMHAFIGVYKSVNSLINSFVTDIALFWKR